MKAHQEVNLCIFRTNIQCKISNTHKELEALKQCIPCQGTSYQCRHLANQYERQFISVNHFRYLPRVTNLKNNPCIQTVIRIATEI